jgi:hypothetical protein
MLLDHGRPKYSTNDREINRPDLPPMVRLGGRGIVEVWPIL